MNTIPHTARGLEGVLAYCQLDGKVSSACIARAISGSENADTALLEENDLFPTKAK